MKAFFDSSALAKRYIQERGSEAVEALCQKASELAVSVICVPEIISALNRRLRERILSPREYNEAKHFLLADIQDAVVINLTPSVIASSMQILEKNPVRAMDALQVACAQAWQADVFVSADVRQLASAKKTGLRTNPV